MRGYIFTTVRRLSVKSGNAMKKMHGKSDWDCGVKKVLLHPGYGNENIENEVFGGSFFDQ